MMSDTLDGRIVRSAIHADSPEGLKLGMIVELRQAETSPKASDRTIDQIAKNHNGLYSPALHQADDPRATPGYIKAHVIRLEALRRMSGIVERLEDGTWRISEDHLANVETAQRKRALSQPRTVEILSALPVQDQVNDIGLTWLDQTPVTGSHIKGFGAEVGAAAEQRRDQLRARHILTGAQKRLTLQQVEHLRHSGLNHAGAKLAEKLGRNYHPAPVHGQVSGKFSQHVDLADGRYAVLEHQQKFTLVRWRQVMERRRGLSMTGTISGKNISWKFGTQRSRGLSR